MKCDRLIISGPRLEEALVDFAWNHPMVDGLVIGEPLCPYRSRLNEFQIIPHFQLARRRGLYLSYQTPVYTTGENFHNIVALADHLAHQDLLDDVRVQDIGVLHWLRNKLPDNVTLTWSIYGYQREFPEMDIPINQAQIDFLTRTGVDFFDITTAVAYSIYKNRYPLKFNKQLHHYRFDPISFSRECLNSRLSGNKYPPDSPKKEIKDLPCESPLYLQDEDSRGLRYIIEGHRIMEEPDPGEYLALMKSDQEYSSLLIEGRNLKMINESLRQLRDFKDPA